MRSVVQELGYSGLVERGGGLHVGEACPDSRFILGLEEQLDVRAGIHGQKDRDTLTPCIPDRLHGLHRFRFPVEDGG
jgi:hypothetical protein